MNSLGPMAATAMLNPTLENWGDVMFILLVYSTVCTKINYIIDNAYNYTKPLYGCAINFGGTIHWFIYFKIN